VLDRLRHFQPILICRFFVLNWYRYAQERTWHSVTKRWKVSHAAASDDSCGEPVTAGMDAFDLLSANTFILGLIIAPNNHTTPTDTYYWARTREWWRQPCVRLYYTCSLQCLMCAAFWNSDYRPTGNGVKSSDGLVLFENCKNITGFFTHWCQRCASLHCT